MKNTESCVELGLLFYYIMISLSASNNTKTIFSAYIYFVSETIVVAYVY